MATIRLKLTILCLSIALHTQPAWADNAAAAVPPELAITIAAGAPDAEQHIPYVDVTIVAQNVHRRPGEDLFRLPVEANTVVTSAKDLRTIEMEDAQGAIAVTAKDVVEDASNRTRFWQTPRAIDGAVTVRYRVPIDPTVPPIPRPQYEIRTEQGIFSAAANAFVLRPADGTSRRVRIHWDFSAFGPGGVGVSSFGVGDTTTAETVPAERLDSVYYMGGRTGVFPTAQDGFFGAWQGMPAFPMEPLMQWAADLHRFYGKFFGYTPPSFGVFGRTNERNPGSGIGLTDSFAFTFNHTSKPDGLRSLLAHEMLHSWVRSLDESMDTAGGLDRAWFGEGLAVYYQRALPYRADMISAADFLKDLNETAGRYYTNVKIGVPNADIAAGFWLDTRIRVLPYDRGSLYFATVDAEIRARSHGRRSLDDLVRTMLDTRRTGAPMNETLWRSLLKVALGDRGITEFEAMLAGKTIVPPSDAFGAEFHRTTRMLRRFDLGFNAGSLLTRPKIVQGLIAGSNAQQAGLRDGDEILNAFSQDGLQGDQEAFLTLDIRRDSETLHLRYQPRAEAVTAFQWVSNAELRPAVR